MAVTEINGKKFIQVSMDATGGDWVMSKEAIIREVRLTGLTSGDYMTFYEAAGDNPVVFRLDYDRAATILHGRLPTKLGFIWADCSLSNPASAILSIEVE